MKNHKRAIRQNKRLMTLLVAYALLLVGVALIACMFSVRQKKEELSSQIELAMAALAREYRSMTEDFYQIYMPIFDNPAVYGVLSEYFTSGDETISPGAKRELSSALMQMLLRNDNVEWIALYAPHRSVNYLMSGSSRTLYALGDSFPHMPYLKNRKGGMDVLGMTPIESPLEIKNTFAICGGVPPTMNNGAILVGYKTEAFSQISDGYRFLLDSMHLYIVSSGQVVYSSVNQYDSSAVWQPLRAYRGVCEGPGNQTLYAIAQTCASSTSYLVCTMQNREMRGFVAVNAMRLLALVAVFAAISYAIILRMLHRINREVWAVQDGLREIGANDLDFRIQGRFTHSGLAEIAQSINETAFRLKENVNRAHYWQLRQKEAELSDLQSKFNPHFLYNTLEMLRCRCLQCGMNDIAELISSLAQIFRGLIGKKAFVSLWEELANSKRYLALFSARYEDQVDVRIHMDTELLNYGVIRNLFQPLIENYFQYGFDTSVKDNYILIRGESAGDAFMRLYVEDNGSGMTDDAIHTLNDRLRLPITEARESYGLKNLHQRLVLFYGEGCGLEITRNGERGLRVAITVKKLTCEEYENGKHAMRMP